MSLLISAATGDFTAAATWKVADTTMLLDTYALSTAASGTYQASLGATPGAITIDGYGVNLLSRIAAPVGTFFVELYNATDALSVSVTQVNVSDLSVEGGWHICAISPITLLAGKSYTIRVKCSTASEVTVLRDATANNWARLLRTTTTAAPAAGYNMIVAGEHTGVGAFSSFVVTMNNTASTIFGTVSATIPALRVCNKGSLPWATAASTNYLLKLAGYMWVDGGGTHTIGTSGTPMPVTSTATLEFNVATNVDSGLEVHNAATFTAYGSQLRTVNRALLAADASAGSTVLTTSVALDAKAGDRIVIGPTNRTITEAEVFVLGVDTVGTTLTLPSGLLYNHSGSTDRQAEIINLTRNVVIKGSTTSLCGYVYAKNGAVVNCTNTEFTMLGSATTNRRGITVETISPIANFTNCSFHTYFVTAASAYGVTANLANSGYTAVNCDFYDAGYLANYFALTPAAATSLLDNNWIIGRGMASSYGILVSTANVTATNNRVAGVANSANFATTVASVMGDISNNIIHSSTNGFTLSGIINSSGTGNRVWRTGGQAVSLVNCNNCVYAFVESVGNVTSSLNMNGNRRCRVKLGVAKGETGFTQPYGVYIAGPNPESIVYDSVFGAAGAPGSNSTGDIVTTALYADLAFQNTQFLSPTELAVSTWNYGIGYRSEKHQGVAGNNKYVRFEGTMARDTVIYDAGGTASLRMTPTQAAIKFQSEPTFTTSVISGGTATPSVRVRKSVVGDGTAYNGNQPRLILRANPVAGITSDTVIATAVGAAGSWETLTGTTPAVTEDARLEFIIDCDGTTGWINVDNFTVGSDDTSKFDIWHNGAPYAIGALSLTNFTDVDQDKVELGYAYKYNSSINNRTGTRVQPTVGTVQIGVTYGPSSGLTGTYDGSDRYTDPGIANVRNGTAYQFNSLTNNREGDVVEPVASTVLSGVTYGTLSSLTGTLVAPDAATIAAAVLAAAATTPIQSDIRKVNNVTVDGTGTPSDPWGPV